MEKFNIAAFYEALRNGVTHFIYVKKDGSLRVAKGTKNFDFIPSEDVPTGGGNEMPDNIETYYDVDKGAWRCLDINRLLWTASRGLNIGAIEANNIQEQNVMDLATRIINDHEQAIRDKMGPGLFD
jgi:hypothetical protein